MGRFTPDRKRNNTRRRRRRDDSYDEADDDTNTTDEEPATLEERRVANGATLKKYVETALWKLGSLSPRDLLRCSPYGTDELRSLLRCVSDFERLNPSIRQLSTLSTAQHRELMDASFDGGHGAAAFTRFTWRQIADSGVVLTDCEIMRIVLAKLVLYSAYPGQTVPERDISTRLIRFNLHTAVADIELVGVGASPIAVSVSGVDCALVACMGDDARMMVTILSDVYVEECLANAISDGNTSHSSLEVLGRF